MVIVTIVVDDSGNSDGNIGGGGGNGKGDISGGDNNGDGGKNVNCVYVNCGVVTMVRWLW